MGVRYRNRNGSIVNVDEATAATLGDSFELVVDDAQVIVDESGTDLVEDASPDADENGSIVNVDEATAATDDAPAEDVTATEAVTEKPTRSRRK